MSLASTSLIKYDLNITCGGRGSCSYYEPFTIRIQKYIKCYSSHNCIVHKIALGNQDAICYGFNDTIIQKALEGKMNLEVNLKECIALGDNYSRHIISVDKGSNRTPP
jgi:hypothetical protein